MGFGFAVGALGGLFLAHAAYSTIQYRGVLKIMEEEFSGPPTNVVVELLLGLILCMFAGLAFPGKFLSILPDSEENGHEQRQSPKIRGMEGWRKPIGNLHSPGDIIQGLNKCREGRVRPAPVQGGHRSKGAAVRKACSSKVVFMSTRRRCYRSKGNRRRRNSHYPIQDPILSKTQTLP